MSHGPCPMAQAFGPIKLRTQCIATSVNSSCATAVNSSCAAGRGAPSVLTDAISQFVITTRYSELRHEVKDIFPHFMSW